MSDTPDPNADPLGWLESRALWQGSLFRSLLQEVRAGDRLPPGTRLGSFRIVEELGAGGMAVVYRAQRDDGQFDQSVAIKCVPANPSTRDIELFQRERQIQATLNHPNIARLLDGGTLDGGRAWLAMELVDGQHIDAHADSNQLDLPARVRLVQQVIAAVAHAHQRLLLHRDIKPSNVLVDTEGRVKLLDFGIAGWIDESAQVHAYSPGWASPEQSRNETVGPASDQYQIGLLLGRLIDPLLPSTGQRTRELRAILAKARHDDPEQRYHSVAEFGAELERWLEGLPVLAMRGGWGYALNCAIRRRPWLSLGSATAALLLLGLLIGFNWRLQVENARTERAAAIAENVNRFLTEDLLSQADPYNTPKPDLSVREVLDRARAGLGGRFVGEPGIEAGIRATLARSYSGVGEYDVATQEYERAIELAEAIGEHAPDELGALRAERADMRSRLGDVSAALAELKLLGEQERARAGGDNRLQISFALQAIEIQVAASQTETALAAIALLQPRLAILAADDTLRIELLAAEGEAAMRLAKFSQGDRALQEAEKLAGRLLGAESPRLQLILQNRAILYRQMGQLTPALELERRVLAWQEQRFGRQHPETQRTLNELASMLQDDRQFELAEQLFREVLAERERKLGVGSVLTRNSLNNLGLVLSLQNKLDEAEVHYRRALDVERELLGADAFDVLILAHNLAGLLRKRGELDAALALSRDTVERAERTLSAERHEPALFRVGLAQTLQKLGRYAEARVEFTSARERLAKLLGADHARIAKLDEMLAALETERLAH